MTDIAELADDILWEYYTEKDFDFDMVERLKGLNSPWTACYVRFKKDKALLFVPGRNDDDSRKLYLNTYDVNTNDDREILKLPYLTRNDLKGLSDGNYKFENINDRIKARKTFNGGLEFIACDIRKPAKVVHLEEPEVRVLKAVL